MASSLILAALVVVGSCVAIAAGAELDLYDNPVRSSADDEVTSLPMLNEPVTFRHYSGYLKADDKGKKFLHYWFVEATEDPSNKPLLLWLNGGPGCSSMEGLFSELGPFQLNSNGTEVHLRKYSWNKLANVIFLESPAGVGYSYSTAVLKRETDDTTAQENYLSLKSFFEKFPQYKSNPLYLSGESYAGVYLPTLGLLVDADKELNLKGIAIGNGYLDAAKLEESLVYFLYFRGFIGKTLWDRISQYCCKGQPPERKSCTFFSSPACGEALVDGISQGMDAKGLNPYNMYGDCPTSNLTSAPLTPHHVHQQMRKVLSQRRSSSGDLTKPFEIIKLGSPASQLRVGGVPCFDGDNMVIYLNNPDVRKAAHIPKRLGRWDVCANLNYVMTYPIQPGGLAPQIKSLIDSDRKLALLVFNGDTDLVCNALGDEWFVDDLGRKVIVDYAPWKVDNQIGGFVKHYDGITYATVRGSGHMVPEFRPKEAFAMIEKVLNSTNHGALMRAF